MRSFSLDGTLALLRSTILHPVASVFLLGGLIFSGAELSPIAFGSTFASTTLVRPISGHLRWALLSVASAWVLQLNRFLVKNSLNPASKSKLDWPNEVVVVTGGAAGIGAELVRKLESLDATIVVLDIAPLTLTPGRKTHYIKCNISSSSETQDAAKAIASRYGPATMLVANAGVVNGQTLLDATEAGIKRTFDVNVLGMLWCVRAFLPDMIARNHGHVLIVASATAFASVAGMADYSASKAAVNSLYEGLQTELKHKHGNPSVAVSAIFPATIATKMFKDLDSPDAWIMPLLQPEEVAERMFGILCKGERHASYRMYRT